MDLTNICPEVDKRWNGEGLLDLDWFDEHIKTCRHCQHIMRMVGPILRGTIQELLGDKPDPIPNN